MPILSARHVFKAYGGDALLAGVSLTVRSGDRVGLLGANGAGKSTLLRIVAGVEQADSGTIERRRSARVRFLPQEPSLESEKTPRQIVERGLSEWQLAVERHAELSRALELGDANPTLIDEQSALAEAIEHLGGWDPGHVALEMLEHLGVREIDRAVGTMSGGERRRVALAELLVSEPALAILDEPTNHLDPETIEWLEQYLAERFRGAVLMVTHDRYVLDRVAERIFELEGGALTEFSGGYAGYLEQKAELLAHAARVEQNRLNLLRRERAWLERGARARTTKQKARVERAEALLGAKAAEDVAHASFDGFEAGAPRTGKTILDLEDVGLDVGGRRLFAGLTLRLVRGERVGVLGRNGVGKTSLLRLVAGEIAPSCGRVVIGANTRVVYFDQTRSTLVDEWSVFDNVAERAGADRSPSEVLRIGDRTIEMRTYLEQFLFDGQGQRQKVRSLSGGERARVALALALKTGANLLLLDEPTNDLDVPTLGALEELLIGWPGCAIVVSHDRYFLDRIATSTLVFETEGAVTPYPGGYETYRSLKRQAEARTQADAPETPAGSARPSPLLQPREGEPPSRAGPRPLTFAEKKELGGILDEISSLEATVSALAARLSDPALYAGGPDEARLVQADHVSASDALAGRIARWEELEARRDVKRG